ncbi:F-box/RNI-like superfamily protein [Hibiscus syriacus]|uniref:F-box/RNI-like superfamily protein n=1 Tax=Hibiscus syriacus TaxID=106335 RepID=A0A6A2WUA0_HIBSY|nr:F-box/RNI-like superfamily protein [Hibiscus syriacus]
MESSELKRSKDSVNSDESARRSSFPDEVLERVLSLLKSHRDRSSLSLVCKDWYHAERWSRTHVFIGNCYSVSPEIVVRRFPRIRSVTLKGKPRFSDFNLVPENWGANIHACWSFSRPSIRSSKSLGSSEWRSATKAWSSSPCLFLTSKLSLLSCDGFSTNGLAAIATHCKSISHVSLIIDVVLHYWEITWNLTELDIQENGIDDIGGSWLSCFPESFTSLEALNFANLTSDINFDELEKLELTVREYEELESALSNCKNMHTLSGLWDAKGIYLPPCTLHARLGHGRRRRTGSGWIELPFARGTASFPSDPFDDEIVHGVTEAGFVAVSFGCPRLHYVLYFCRQMTNAAVATIVQNCPDFTHFRLCIMNPGQPDHLTNEPMDEAFGAVVKTCTKLQRLSVSGRLTDLTFEYIGRYAKNLETLSVAFAGSSDWGMQCVLGGCPKLRKLELLAREMPRLNVEVQGGMPRHLSLLSEMLGNLSLFQKQLLSQSMMEPCLSLFINIMLGDLLNLELIFDLVSSFFKWLRRCQESLQLGEVHPSALSGACRHLISSWVFTTLLSLGSGEDELELYLSSIPSLSVDLISSGLIKTTFIVMVKSVLTALPSYAMQTCFLPRKICDEIEIHGFIWGHSHKNRGVDLVKRDERRGIRAKYNVLDLIPREYIELFALDCGVDTNLEIALIRIRSVTERTMSATLVKRSPVRLAQSGALAANSFPNKMMKWKVLRGLLIPKEGTKSLAQAARCGPGASCEACHAHVCTLVGACLSLLLVTDLLCVGCDLLVGLVQANIAFMVNL